MAYHLKGQVVGAGSCEWGCPCSIEMMPAQGCCRASYVWHVQEGHYQGLSMAGCIFAMVLDFPGPLTEGAGTGMVVVHDRISRKCRNLVEAMIVEIPPFNVFYQRLTTFLGFSYLPIDLKVDGVYSRVSIPESLECALMPMTNPVTGTPEYASLSIDTGTGKKRQELCATQQFSLTLAGQSYDHSGQSGEFAVFEYRAARPTDGE